MWKTFRTKKSGQENPIVSACFLSSIEFITATRVVQESLCRLVQQPPPALPLHCAISALGRDVRGAASALRLEPQASSSSLRELRPYGLPRGEPSFILPFQHIHRKTRQDRSSRLFMPKRTFQPNRRHRSKTHGFRTRMKTKSGRAVISRRRAKGRKRVSVKPGFRE